MQRHVREHPRISLVLLTFFALTMLMVVPMQTVTTSQQMSAEHTTLTADIQPAPDIQKTVFIKNTEFQCEKCHPANLAKMQTASNAWQSESLSIAYADDYRPETNVALTKTPVKTPSGQILFVDNTSQAKISMLMATAPTVQRLLWFGYTADGYYSVHNLPVAA